MKKLLFITLLFWAFNCHSQVRLNFSKAIYIALKSTKSSNFIAKDTTIIVPNGKVWEITNAKVFMTYDNRMLADKTYLYLNDHIITFSNNQFAQYTDHIWLPSGKYRFTIRTEEKNQIDGRFMFNAFISGVEYDPLN